MSDSLNITLIQSSLHWENIDANLQLFSEKIASIKNKTDLIVLPEMFSTGFSLTAEKVAEEAKSSKAIEWMKNTAEQKECAIVGSLMLKEKGKYYNRLIWMNSNGTFKQYDKRHLFAFSKEDEIYTAGTERIIVELNGWKICPLVCYDLRFPVWSRNNKTDAYDLLLYVANWPERRNYAWKQLLIARAIENQSFVVGVNRVGNDGNDLYYSGDSMVVDALGNILYHRRDDEDVFTIELKKEELNKVRQTFQFLKDADSFVINPKSKIKGH